MSHPRILLACRGSVRDGLGHVMRTRAVARALSGLAHVHMVIVGDRHAASLMAEDDIDSITVSDDRQVADAATGFAPSVICLDMLSLDPAVVRRLALFAPLVGLSPILDYADALTALFTRTSRHSVVNGPTVHAGPDFAVIGDHCRRIATDRYRSNLVATPVSVAIAMGGTDPWNKTLRALQAVKEASTPLLIWLLLGEGYEHAYESLVDAVRATRRHEIIMAKTTRSMWRVLESCALAVVSSGVTTYEAAFAGLPTLNLASNDRDRQLAADLEERGACITLGPPFEAAVEPLAGELARLFATPSLLVAAHEAGQALIDGRGAERVATAVIVLAAGAGGRAPPAARLAHGSSR